MADLFQGSLLPSTTTTTSTQQTSPEFYTNYLQDIANLGQNAVQQGGVAGFSPLQSQAFNMAPSTAFSGQGAATQAQALTGAAGTTAAPDIVNQYMNPYTGNVVNEMARLQQQNLQRNVLPTIAGGGVGTGSFGSRRQQQALGQSLSDMQANLTGQQYGALNTGYQNALQSAQTDLSRQLQAGQGMGNVAQQQYQIGSGGLNTLSSLGALQQAQGQRQLDYPMVQTQNFANLLQGLNIPTGQVQQTVAPGQQGQYTNSPLSQIAGLGSLLAAISGTGTTSAQQASLIDQLKSLFTSSGGSTTPAVKNGGSINSYADGGTVNPTGMQVMPGTYDSALEGTMQNYVYPETSIEDIQPGGQYYNIDGQFGENMIEQNPNNIFESNPGDPIMYTGGTPYFDETTGTYNYPGTKPFNPQIITDPVVETLPTGTPIDEGYVSPYANYEFDSGFQDYLDRGYKMNQMTGGDMGTWNYDPENQSFTNTGAFKPPGTPDTTRSYDDMYRIYDIQRQMQDRYNAVDSESIFNDPKYQYLQQELFSITNPGQTMPEFPRTKEEFTQVDDMPVRNTNTPLPYERNNSTIQPRARTNRVPLKTPDFTNMNPASRNLIRNLDKATNRIARIDTRVPEAQARINDLQARKQSLSGLNAINRAPKIQARIDNKQARINNLQSRKQFLSDPSSINRGRT